MFRANICSNSIIGSGNTAVSVCTVGRAPRRGPLTPQLKRSLDTRTKNVPYTILFKLVPKFKLLHKSEVTVAQGTLLILCRPRRFAWTGSRPVGQHWCELVGFLNMVSHRACALGAYMSRTFIEIIQTVIRRCCVTAAKHVQCQLKMKSVWQHQRWEWCDGQWRWACWNIGGMAMSGRKQRWNR